MMKKRLLAAGFFMAGISSAYAVPYGFLDARSVAMGNVSVATGSITTAAFSNPAMLAINKNDDSFALLLPAVGAQAVDNGGMVDLIDEFQALVDTASSTADFNRLIDISSELSGTSLTANANIGTALVFAGDTFSVAGSYRVSGQAGITYEQTAAGTTSSAPQGNIDALGYAAQELGVSIATKLSVAGIDVAIGVRPKTTQVDSITWFDQNIATVDTDNALDDAVEQDLGSFSSLDAGIAIQLLDSFTVGLVAQNVMSETLTTNTGQEFKFDTHMRAGVAYQNSFLTVAADMDLTEIDPILNATSGLPIEDPSKMLSVGVELNALDFMQLRVGYQSNMASGATSPDILSAGVGFWLGFHLDVAVTAAEDSSFGAFVQTGFRF